MKSSGKLYIHIAANLTQSKLNAYLLIAYQLRKQDNIPKSTTSKKIGNIRYCKSEGKPRQWKSWSTWLAIWKLSFHPDPFSRKIKKTEVILCNLIFLVIPFKLINTLCR